MASLNQTTLGWVNGALGVAIFSASLPATRVAVAEFNPLFLTATRASIAAILGALFLFALKQPLPKRDYWFPLAIVALGVVLGFPLFTALALQFITSSHSAVFVGILPLMTAIFAVIRGGERPQPAFWIFSIVGCLLVAGFAFLRSDSSFSWGDVFMIIAVAVCGLGYAEGAKLTRHLGGWQVISWALLLSLPAMALLAVIKWPTSFSGISMQAWTGLVYVSVFSMLVGFIFWYRGLAQGGIAAVGQLQLVQPFLTLVLSWLLLSEHISWTMIATMGGAVACVFGAKKFSAAKPG